MTPTRTHASNIKIKTKSSPPHYINYFLVNILLLVPEESGVLVRHHESHTCIYISDTHIQHYKVSYFRNFSFNNYQDYTLQRSS
jgi:hypothetical protein